MGFIIFIHPQAKKMFTFIQEAFKICDTAPNIMRQWPYCFFALGSALYHKCFRKPVAGNAEMLYSSIYYYTDLSQSGTNEGRRFLQEIPVEGKFTFLLSESIKDRSYIRYSIG